MGCTSSSVSVVNDTSDTHLTDLLTPKQVEVLRRTWDIIAEDAEEVGVVMFARLFQTDKDLKGLFVGLAGDDTHYEDGELGVDDLQLKVHSRVVMDVLGAAVECLDDPSVLNPVLFALGQMHAPYGVEPRYLPRLWPAIKYALRQTLQENFTAEVEKTWRVVYHFIVGKMVAGITRSGTPLGLILSSDEAAV